MVYNLPIEFLIMKEEKVLTDDEKIQIVFSKICQSDSKTSPDFAKYLALEEKLVELYLNKNFEVQTETIKELFPDDHKEWLELSMIEKLQYKPLDDLRIKLVITETEGPKLVKSLISPFLSSINIPSLQFGWFHSALVLGPWYLEWNDSSLCIPRTCHSKFAVVCLDIGSDIGHGNVDETIKKVSKVICKWNTSKTYNYLNSNCQNFIEDVLSSLNINLTQVFQKDGKINQLLTQIKNKGRGEYQYHISPDIKKPLDITKDVLYFDDHKQLDIFLRKLSKLINKGENFDLRRLKDSPYYEDLMVRNLNDSLFRY